MIDLFYFAGLPVAVLGLGRSGLVAAKALMASGAEVWAWDDSEDRRAEAAAAGIPLVDLAGCNWQELTSLVLSPGIPHSFPEPHPVAAAARAHGCEIIGDIELLGRAMRNAGYVGITGTNGKSTTTALVGHMLESAGRPVEVGGNIGIPALELAPLDSGGYYVLEMSSYQLDLTVSITFDVAVLLNVTPDHLERHGGFQGYIASKRLIFHRQTRPRTAVIGVDDEVCQGIWRELAAADEQVVVPVSGLGPAQGGVFAREGVLYDDTEGRADPVLDLRELASLPGTHNWQNAAAAYATGRAVGVAPPVIAACLRSYPGLAHRQELIAVIDGVGYVNDSKATNADAAAKALACYEPIYWIAGGRAKEGGLGDLAALFPRIARAYLIGEAAEAFAHVLAENRVPAEICGDLERAVAAAHKQARDDGRPGAVVLFSPAAASFDQYSDFEVRGEAFRSLVEDLPGERDEGRAARRAAAGRTAAMNGFARTDTSLFGQWWWTVDRWTLAAVAALLGFGVILILAASPAVSERLGLDSFYLARRHLALMPPALAILIAVSLLSPRWIRRLAAVGFVVALLFCVMTLLVGQEIKGATRWISLAGFSLQPSEFVKPTLAVVAAWMFALGKKEPGFPGTAISAGLCVLVVGLLMLQPDVGQAFIVTAAWCAQFFLAGLPLFWVALLAAAGAAALGGAYVVLPHVAQRINSFLDPSAGDRYQIERSMEAFLHGGLFGTGPGEGTVKTVLPDAHSDFIFAVAGEELGLLACLLMVGLFAFVVLRGFGRAFHDRSLFVLLATAGLLTQFGLQTLINMASSLHLIPTKGMTLPFISYGGSSLLALALSLGMVLALTRRRARTGRRGMSAGAVRKVILAAGGSGGHLFPAEALARALLARGLDVVLITDRRGSGFSGDLADIPVHRIAAGGLASGRAGKRVLGLLQLGRGYLQARGLVRRLKADAVAGFGGYASVPSVLAAAHAGLRVVLHEQNAVAGRANRLLAGRAARIATGFSEVGGLKAQDLAKTVVTGNPVRPAVAAVAGRTYAAPRLGETVELLVIGGSQGAQAFNELVPAAVERMSEALRSRLSIAQQVPGGADAAVAARYRAAGVRIQAQAFFDDLAERLARAHLVICRAGASTLAELTCVGRPAILVPLPGSVDGHQTANAQVLADAGAGWLMPQASLTPDALALRLESLIASSDILEGAADSAAALAPWDAAGALADLVCGQRRGNGGDADKEHRAEEAA